MLKKLSFRSIRYRLMIGIVVPLLLITIAFSFVLFFTSKFIIDEHVITQFEDKLAMHMNEFEENLDKDAVEEAIQSKRSQEELVMKMNQFVEERKGIEYIYVVGEVDDKEVIIALNGSEDYLVEYPFTPEQTESLQSGEVVVSSIYSDDFGVHKSLFKPIDGTDALFGIDMDASFIQQLQEKLWFLCSIFVISSILIGVFVSYKLGSYFAKPINTIASAVKKIMAGDLTEQIEVQTNDELGKLANNFELMRQNMSNNIQNVRQNATEAEAKSSELYSLACNLDEVAEQVASATTQSAQGSEELSSHMEVISNTVQKVSDSVSVEDKNIEKIVSLAHSTYNLSSEGKDQAENLASQMVKIQKQGKNTSEQLKELGDKSKNIVTIVKIIKDISAQINLLSLNASIEAARAGEAGKGFSVVAREVQSLANQTDESINHINDNITEILEKTNDVIQYNEQNFQEILTGVGLIQENGVMFSEITKSIEQLSNGTEIIKKESEQIKKITNESLSTIQEIAAISEEATATTEEISASTDQQRSATSGLTNLSKELSEMSENIERMFKVYRI
ncbi:methyl-accepting chemotaxis protein [Bacillus solimangrovi]|uniref:Chemotaxis protein n=1 Tax=Bacillus solimangrovi TaxID=1305675 RepID=A0A1E5LBX4_9BACI|nr:HAMP domain-containing methyl-accepting chemotaxis protein [Bacillus solimangrovi]OEH91573.1 hypothetical protein BFG57_04145 [Bacillus solimangrovi]